MRKTTEKYSLTKRVMAMLLVVMMVLTTAVSAFAVDGGALGGDITAGGGDALISEGVPDNNPDSDSLESILDTIPDNQDSEEPVPDEGDDAGQPSLNEDPGVQDNNAGNWLQEYVKSVLENGRPENSFGASMFRAPRAGGSDLTYKLLTWTPGEANWLVFNTTPPAYLGGGDGLPRITYKGKTAFCGHFNGSPPGGSYSPTEGSDPVIKQILANFDNSDQSDEAYAAAQVAIWAHQFNRDPSRWGGCPGQSMYDEMKNGGADATDIKYNYLYWTGGAQDLITYDNDEEPGDDDDDAPGIHDDDDDSAPEDAFGQVTITKKDDEGRALDGAVFKIDIVFSNGSTGGQSRFEVKDGQRTYYYKHPKGLAGAVFSIYKGDGIRDGEPTGDLVGNYTTDLNGVVFLDSLERGKYTVVEEQAPDGYVLDEAPWRIIEVTDYNIHDVIQVIFRNQPKPNLRIIKKDKETGKVLEGAVFRVGKQNGVEYNEYTTDKNGEIFLEKLDPDWYIITEMRAPTGYLLPVDPELDPIELVPGKTSEVVVTNQVKPSLTILKADAVTMRGLPNATFKLTKRGASEYTTVTTDFDGKAVITGLDAGWYIVEEIKAPAGYIPITEPWNVELKPDEDTVITIPNTKIPSLTIKKVDKLTRNPLKNAEFELRKSDGTVVFKGLTDAYGEIYIERIDPGTYRLKETGAPEGYEVITVEQDVVIEEGTTPPSICTTARTTSWASTPPITPV